MDKQIYQVKSINIGKIETLTFNNKTFESAVKKEPIKDPQYINKLGFLNDEQAFEGHGGVDKALCLYPADHYPFWRNSLNHFVDTALFGENITAVGLTENNAHVGDIFSFGETIIQITEPRTPCYKIATKYDIPELPNLMKDSGYTGFMFRVLGEGMVSPGDHLTLLEPHPEKVTITFVNHVKYEDRYNKEKLDKILSIDEISGALRTTLMKQYRH